MRCYICDSALGENSVKFDSDHQKWDPCPTCLIAVSEVFEDGPTEEEIDEALEEEFPDEEKA